MIQIKIRLFFKKKPYFKPTLQISKFEQKFLRKFDFHQSLITPQKFERLAELLLKYPMVYATSKFDVGKLNSPLHLALKPDAVFKKQRASKVPVHLQDKVNRLQDILD